jgi:hypothetical protein
LQMQMQHLLELLQCEFLPQYARDKVVARVSLTRSDDESVSKVLCVRVPAPR